MAIALLLGASAACNVAGPNSAAGGSSGPGGPSAAGGASVAVDAEEVVVRVGDVTVRAEVADSDSERRRGLMGRTTLPAGHGMIFIFDHETTSGFFMYRTLLPLSIMFVRDDRVVSVREMAPCLEDDSSACPVYHPDGPYTHAVEAPAGTFAAVAPGDPVAIGSD